MSREYRRMVSVYRNKRKRDWLKQPEQLGMPDAMVDSMLAIICGPLGGIRLPFRESALNLPEPDYWVAKCELMLKEGKDKYNFSELEREHGSCGHQLGSCRPENP